MFSTLSYKFFLDILFVARNIFNILWRAKCKKTIINLGKYKADKQCWYSNKHVIGLNKTDSSQHIANSWFIIYVIQSVIFF